jgi:hypothetical protein
VQSSEVRWAGRESTALFTPKSELDFGTLLCWATNSIGRRYQKGGYAQFVLHKNMLLYIATTYYHTAVYFCKYSIYIYIR